MKAFHWLMTALLIGGSSDAAADPAIAGKEAPLRNYHVISDRLGTGGTLSAGAVKWLAADGYQIFIDLRDDFDENEANAVLAEGASNSAATEVADMIAFNAGIPPSTM